MANGTIKQIQVGTSVYDLEATATGYAGNLELQANPYSSGVQIVNELYTNNAYVSEAIWLSPNDIICSDTGDQDGIHLAQYSAESRYLSVDYPFINLNGQTAINGSTYIYGDAVTYNVRPDTNAGYDLGSSNYKYNRLYASYVGTNLYPIASMFASHLSITGDGVTRVSNSYISIYASATNTVTTGTTSYAGILLSASAANAKVRILGYNGIEQSTIGGSIYIRTNYTNIDGTAGSNTYGTIYLMAGSQVSITASNSITISASSTVTLSAASNSMILKAYSSMTLQTTSTTGTNNGLWFKQGAASSLPIVCGWEHDIKLWQSDKLCVRFSVIDTLGYGQIRNTTAISSPAQVGAALSSLAAMLYYNGYSSYEYRALPVCAATQYSNSGTPIGIYATGTSSTSLYFVCAANTNSASTVNISFTASTVLYDNRRKIQYYNS